MDMFFFSLRLLRTRRPSGAHGNDLHRRIRDLRQEPVDDGPVEQELPARSLALTEHDVRDASLRAKAISPSAGFSAFTRTTVAPSASASAMFRARRLDPSG